MEIMLITGMSGAGKTVALKCLEDLGYFAIDNLPPALIPNIAELGKAKGEELERVAVVTDIRGGTGFDLLFAALEKLETAVYTIVFLDASNEVLLRRFSETRRLHPLEGEGLRVRDTINQERILLQPVRERADLVIDTSATSIYELRDELRMVVPTPDELSTTRLTFISFGYKYGHPLDADIVFDVRFLPNPFWEPQLKDLDGTDRAVIEYVIAQPETAEFLRMFSEMLILLLPSYQRQRRPFLTIGLGCTGGRHRSVVLSDLLSVMFRASGYSTGVIHRDLAKR